MDEALFLILQLLDTVSKTPHLPVHVLLCSLGHLLLILKPRDRAFLLLFVMFLFEEVLGKLGTVPLQVHNVALLLLGLPL